MERLGIGILGFAHGHAHAYATRIATFDDAVLVAAWDHDATRGEEGAARHGMAFVADLDELLARPDIHAVIITSETNLHADLVERACAAGKNILCQKPMATTLADCDRIVDAVDRSGVHFQMAFQMRCDPLNQRIKAWIDEGAVGKVGAVRRRHCINFLFNPGLKESPSAWHIDPVANVGMFFDDAVHAADFLYWLFGTPETVMAEIDNVLTDIAPDDTGVALFRWRGGAMGTLFNGSAILAGINTCEIYGDQGVIVQDYDDLVSTAHAVGGGPALRLYRRSTGAWETFEHTVPASHGERLQAVPRPWINDLRAGRPSSATARDGKISVAMCLASYDSARTGRRVSLGDYL
ncbi:MAG: Gfo/Idh/MocA family protein [Armatimonadota bacterium]